MIFPNLDCCSNEAIELDTAKNTRGTTLTKRRFRKISPKGLIYSTKSGATIPMMLPIVIPSNKNRFRNSFSRPLSCGAFLSKIGLFLTFCYTIFRPKFLNLSKHRFYGLYRLL
jgi:hypothetical protein